MRLAADARGLRPGVDGIGRFSLGVIRGLLAARPDWDLRVLASSGSLHHLEEMPLAVMPLDIPRFRPGEARGLLGLLDGMEPDAYLNFSMTGPVPPAPSIFTVHDLMVLELPGYFGPGRLRNLLFRAWFRFLIRRSAAACSAIAVPTQASAASVRRLLGHEEKTFVVGEGQDLFSPDDAVTGQRGHHLLYVGNARAYKNLPRLISALELVADRRTSLPQVVMVVRRDRAFPEFERRLERSSIRSRVSLVSGVDEERLRSLYLQCRMLLAPSVCEGFGLPVLEGMAAGAPVLASEGTALEEVAGDAALLVDPLSVESIARGVNLLLEDEELARRLSAAGPARARDFSWTRTAGLFAQRLEEIT